jgi:hypothetical protein
MTFLGPYAAGTGPSEPFPITKTGKKAASQKAGNQQKMYSYPDCLRSH